MVRKTAAEKKKNELVVEKVEIFEKDDDLSDTDSLLTTLPVVGDSPTGKPTKNTANGSRKRKAKNPIRKTEKTTVMVAKKTPSSLATVPTVASSSPTQDYPATEKEAPCSEEVSLAVEAEKPKKPLSEKKKQALEKANRKRLYQKLTKEFSEPVQSKLKTKEQAPQHHSMQKDIEDMKRLLAEHYRQPAHREKKGSVPAAPPPSPATSDDEQPKNSLPAKRRFSVVMPPPGIRLTL